MARTTTVTGRMGRPMVKVVLNMLTATLIQENLSKTKRMGSVSTLTRTGGGTKAAGRRT